MGFSSNVYKLIQEVRISPNDDLKLKIVCHRCKHECEIILLRFQIDHANFNLKSYAEHKLLGKYHEHLKDHP